MPDSASHAVRRPVAPLLAGLFTVGVWAAVPFLPAGRHWGVAAWRHLPPAAVLGLAAAGILAMLLAHRQAGRGDRTPRGNDRLLATALLIVVPVLFVLFRTRAHFLGDGYQNLELLAADAPLLKASARGTLRCLLLLKPLGGGGAAGAEFAYRAAAVVSGVAFLGAVLVASRALLSGSALRRGFVLVLATSGPVLLFFGYVENYAAFVAMVTVYALWGVHAARTGRGKWLGPGLVGVAILLHGLGFALVPSLFWLLVDGTPAGRALAPPRGARRWVGPAVAVVVAFAALGFARRRSLALELMLLSWTRERFTVDGYTLASTAHLLDLLNLGLLLLPGVAVLAACALAPGARAWLRTPPARFLAVLILGTSGACFVLDPKLGMPRDWDLLAFAGVPWIVAAAWGWAQAADVREALRPWGPAAAFLGLLVLGPRVFTLTDADRAVVPFREFLALDHTKSRNAHTHLLNHERDRGREDLAELEKQRWDQEYPERVLLIRAAQARVQGDLATAERLNREVIRLSPQYFDAYNNLGDVLLGLDRNEEALQVLEIAHVMDPPNTDILLNVGVARFVLGDEDGAARAWEGVLRLDPYHYLARRNLAHFAQSRGDVVAYDRHTAAAAASPDASGRVVAEWGAVLLARGRAGEAQAAFAEALRRGVEGSVREQIVGRYPDLAEIHGPEVAPESSTGPSPPASSP